MDLAVLGMGNMGRAFAGRALERGHGVTVWNRSPGKAGELLAGGAVERESPGLAVQEAQVVLTVLADDAAVLDICLGDHGVLAALAPGAIFVNVSTVSPGTARRLADEGPPGRVLEAPVMGSPAAISAGLGRFLVGGPAAAVAAAGPLWDDLGAGFVHCGPAGAGVTMKLVSNLLLVTGVAVLAEAIATARAHGIADELVQTVFADSPVVSDASRLRLANVLDDQHPGWFSPALARKDVRLAVGLAEQANIPVRIGPAAEALLTKLIGGGRRWPDFAAVIEALDQDSGE